MPRLIVKPFAHHDHPREIIRQFTPNWFTVTMGTGVVALALNQFPENIPLLHQIGAVLWMANIILFATCTVLYAGRWIFFTRDALPIFGHPVMPMFLGAISMGLATIVNGFLAFGISHIGHTAVEIAVVLWWVDAVLAIAVGLLVPFLMFTRQTHSIESMTAVWLLPIVASEVTAASGGLLAVHLAGAGAAHLLLFCYVLWALSVPLALGVLVVLSLRLVLHKLPKRDMAVSSWLALGPLRTGALGLLVLGHDAPALLGAAGMGSIGQVAQGVGIIGGLVLWGYGAWWLIMAAAITLTLSAGRSAVQYGLVGLHLSARRVHALNAESRRANRHCRFHGSRRCFRGRIGRLLGARHRAHSCRRISRTSIQRALPR